MSGTSRQFQAVITVNDRTAAPLAMIAARLRAIAGMSGMERIRASALGVQRSFAALAGSATRWAAISAGAAAAVGVGLVASLNGAVEAGGALTDLSDRLGMSIEDIQSLGFAFEQGGVRGEQFTGAMERLNRGIADVAAGKNQELAGQFRRMGISVRDGNGQIRSATAILPQLAQAMQRNTNGAVRTRIAMTAFGRAGGPLIAVLAQGAEALRQQQRRWYELDGQITGESAPALDAVGDGMNEVKTSLLGVRNAIAVQLAPALGPLLTDLANWIAANRELVAIKVEEWVRAVADFIKDIDFTKLREDFTWFIGEAKRIYDAIGGWKTIAIATAAYLTGPFVASIAVLALAITTTLIPVLTRATTLMAGLGAKGAAAAAARIAAASGGAAAASAAPAAAGAAAAASAAPAAAGAAAAPAAAAVGGSWLSGLAGAARGALAFAGTAANLAGIAAAAGMILGSAEDPEIRRQSRERMDAGANGAQRIPDELWNAPDDQPAPPSGASWLSRLPSLFGQRGASAPPVQPVQGEVNVNMRFENVPPGARVDAEARGAGVRQPELDVGYATMGAY